MFHQTCCSKKLLINIIELFVFIEFVNARTTTNSSTIFRDDHVIEKRNETLNDSQILSLKSDASERVEKILNVPVTLNFDDEPVTKPGRGYYGGHRRNYEVTPDEEKIDDGQFGSRIILGIVHNTPETTTAKPFEDQRKSQTIVKFFDKEDYDGIKSNPIVVDDPYEDLDGNQQEKKRDRKEIIDLKQNESPISPDKNVNQLNEEQEDLPDAQEETEDIKEDEELEEKDVNNYNEYKERPSNIKDEEDHEETHEKLPETKNEETEESPRHIETENDNDKQRYEEYNIPYNHKETYTEVEGTANKNVPYEEREVEVPSQKYEKHEETFIEEPAPKLRIYEDSVVEQRPEKYSYHKNNHDESSKATELKEDVTHSDQKESAAIHTHEDVKKKKKGGKHSSGKGKEHHSEHHGHKGDKGLKEYKGYHEETKSKKGHHDKEGHDNKYTDKGGTNKKHHEEHGHHGEHQKGEKGEKASDFSEEGKHSKGHSTKGEHNIHKKDEYEKKQEFYDEHHEGGEHEKHGGFSFDDHFEKGGHKKGGHHKKGNHEDHYGKKSHHEKGNHYDEEKGHKKASGHDEHHKHHAKHGKKGGHSGKKHWSYKKGTGGGKKKHKAGQYVAHSTPQHIRRVAPSVHAHYREEGTKYPHYVGKIYVRNDNRRSDDIEDNNSKIIDEQNSGNNTELHSVTDHIVNTSEPYTEKTRQRETTEEEIPLNSEEVEEGEETKQIPLTSKEVESSEVQSKPRKQRRKYNNKYKSEESQESEEENKYSTNKQRRKHNDGKYKSNGSQESEGEKSIKRKQRGKHNDDKYEIKESQEDIDENSPAEYFNDDDYFEANSSSSAEETITSPNNSSNPLPKIYLIIPNNYEEQLRQSKEDSDETSSSIEIADEAESSSEDSKENYTEEVPAVHKIKAIHRKISKIVEPIKSTSFPEEHRRRLSEIQYVVHRVGTELDNKMKENSSSIPNTAKNRRQLISHKPRTFSNHSSEEE